MQKGLHGAVFAKALPIGAPSPCTALLRPILNPMSNPSTTLPPPPESDTNLLRVKLLTLDNLHKLNSLLRSLEGAGREDRAPESLANSLDARVHEWLDEHYGSETPPSEPQLSSAERDERPTQRVAECAPTWPPVRNQVEQL